MYLQTISSCKSNIIVLREYRERRVGTVSYLTLTFPPWITVDRTPIESSDQCTRKWRCYLVNNNTTLLWIFLLYTHSKKGHATYHIVPWVLPIGVSLRPRRCAFYVEAIHKTRRVIQKALRSSSAGPIAKNRSALPSRSTNGIWCSRSYMNKSIKSHSQREIVISLCLFATMWFKTS